MGELIIQNDFTHGELSRKLFARVDLSIYRKGAQKLRNVVIIPQGGAKRRFGTKQIFQLELVEDTYQLASFEADDENAYLLWLIDGSLEIFFDDVLVTSVAPVPWTAAQLVARQVKFAQTHDRMVFVNPDFTPFQLTRTAHPATWAFAAITFRNLPTFDFQDTNYDAFTFTLLAVTIGSSTTLTSSTAIFTDDFIGGTFTAVGPLTATEVGIAKITAVGSAIPITTATVTILSTFNTVLIGTGVLGSQTLLTEPAFSVARGFPRSVTFYEGRMWFGGTKSLPQSLFGSVVNDFFNFDEGTGLDSDAINITIGSNQVNRIDYIVSDKNLQIFTNTAEFSIPQLDEEPLTPKQISVRKQSNDGTAAVHPQIIDNQTLFIRSGGKAVMSYLFNADGSAYRSDDVSTLSEQVIINPVDASVLRRSSSDDANFMFLVNGDGTLATYQVRLDEKISAWTLSDTDGLIKRTTSVKDDIYFLVLRTIDGTPRTFLEKLDFNLFSDSVILFTSGSPTRTITGLTLLEGKTVQIRGEVQGIEGFFVYPEQEVVSGEVIIEEDLPAIISAEVGLKYEPLIQPMPVNLLTQEGDALYVPKRVVRIFVDFFESVGIFIDGTVIPYRQFGETLDEPLPIESGLFEFDNMGGWDRRQAPIITQPDPLPMTILGIGYEVTL